jgi:hypothetical protein
LMTDDQKLVTVAFYQLNVAAKRMKGEKDD